MNSWTPINLMRRLAWSAVPLVAMASVAAAQETVPDATPACSTCHACPEPSATDPCLLPCPAAHVPASVGAAVHEGPETVVLKALENLYDPVAFDHKAHAAMSETSGGCQLCHHYGPEDTIPPCSACHAEQASWDNLRQPGLRGAYHRQCMGCHREWQHEAACAECHAIKGESGHAVAEVRIDLGGSEHPPIQAAATYLYETKDAGETVIAFHHEDHASVFQLACSACHKNESCATCHDAAAGATPRIRENMHETCAECHREAIESDCTVCHTDEPKPRFSHVSRTGFALDELHAVLSCGDCHAEGTRGAARCDGCHETAEGPLPKGTEEKAETQAK